MPNTRTPTVSYLENERNLTNNMPFANSVSNRDDAINRRRHELNQEENNGRFVIRDEQVELDNIMNQHPEMRPRDNSDIHDLANRIPHPSPHIVSNSDDDLYDSDEDLYSGGRRRRSRNRRRSRRTRRSKRSRRSRRSRRR